MASEKLLLKDFVFISTLSDLGMDQRMLKLDVNPGEYVLREFYSGYVLTTDEYRPNCKDIVKIFNTRAGDKGLSGFYWCGETEDPDHMRLFNNYIRYHLDEDYVELLYSHMPVDILREDIGEDMSDVSSDNLSDSSDGTDYLDDERWCAYAKSLKRFDRRIISGRGLNGLPQCHHLPVMFYLNRHITHDDLKLVSLISPSIKSIGNILRIWRIHHEQYGDIGMAVLQDLLYCMMFDQAAIAFFATNTAQAFGNFKSKDIEHDKFINNEVRYPCYKFICKFNPCHCDTNYKINNCCLHY